MRKKINITVLLVGLIATLITYFAVNLNNFQSYQHQLKEQIITILDLMAREIKNADDPVQAVQKYGDAFRSDYEILLYQNDTILYSTFFEPTSFDPSQYAELKNIDKDLVGYGSRYNPYRGYQTYYVASKLENGYVLRLGATTRSIASFMQQNILILMFCLFAEVLMGMIFSRKLTRSTEKIAEEMVPVFRQPFSGLSFHRMAVSADEFNIVNTACNQMLSDLLSKIDLLQKSNQKTELLMNRMSEGFMVIEDNGNIVIMNEMAKKIFDMDPDQYENPNILLYNGDVKVYKAIKATLETGGSQSIELIKKHPEHKIYDIYISRIESSLEQTADGGAIILMRDITVIKQTEQSRADFTANVSHELKTPLTSIRGFAETLKNGAIQDPEAAGKFLDIILIECDRLIHMINDILKLAELDAISIAPQQAVTDLHTVAKDVQTMLQEKAKQKQITLDVTGQSVLVHAPQDKMKQLILNLADNAVNYNRPGGSVTIITEYRDSKPTLIVSDTGIGIPAQHQSRVFERFYTVDQSRSRISGGTGLGLSIVKHLAAIFQANIQLQSAENMGTTVTVTFPNQEDIK